MRELNIVLVKRSTDSTVKVEAPEKTKITEKDGTLTIEGDGLSTSKGNITITGGNIFGNMFSSSKTVIRGSGNISINNGGKSVNIVGDKVYIDGKLVSGKDDGKEMPEEKPVIIYIPDDLNCTIEDCNNVQFEEDFKFQIIVLQTQGFGDIRSKNIEAQSATLTASGQSEIKIASLNTSVMVGTASGQATLKVKDGKFMQAIITSSGQSTLKVEGIIENVIANSSGQSTCKFTTPTNRPNISKSGQSTCKAI
ncbi:TPA: hypothetical protein DIC40_05135 [Patescibacteria group bacterium]|nr:hypothetical protein [Candidatus Gracilibacteria bacterium]